jgi:fucose permease
MKQFDLSMTAAGMLHYAPMVAIALAGIFLGFIADRLGRKLTIVMGLALFALNSFLFLAGHTFAFFLSLMVILGLSIGIFKTGALALIGDISRSTRAHTSIMNAVEGFFGVGAIIGPFIVTYLLSRGVDWKWLYVVAGGLCVVLILIALSVKYPDTRKSSDEAINLRGTLRMLKDPFALGFSLAAFLYVAIESAVYVWMPTLLQNYDGSLVLLSTYSLTIFFVLRAAGRFLGTWIMARFNWTVVLSLFGLAIFLCFAGSLTGSMDFSVVLLPLSGLFMSVIYPTINSKGISCFPKIHHGSISGIILFFTAAGAALGPLAMGAVSDLFGHEMRYGFILATIFAGIFFTGALLNMFFNPSRSRLSDLEKTEYQEE